MSNSLMWGMMVNLGTNMWEDFSNKLRLNKNMWDEYMRYLQRQGVNLLLVDIGEGLKYESHPELAVEGSWSREMFLTEMEKLRDMGFEVVPKLNFSCCHDFWLKDYARMISSQRYYEVCKNLIDEVCQILKPKYFHLGMDEENHYLQRTFDFICIRQNDLWWHDLYFYQNCVEKHNARAWVWSDYIWDHQEEFLRKMPKEIIQSNWYYGPMFDVDAKATKLDWIDRTAVRAYDALEAHGYDQIPTGSNWCRPENFTNMLQFCAQHVSKEHTLGFLQTPWKYMLEDYRAHQWAAAYLLKEGKDWYESR